MGPTGDGDRLTANEWSALNSAEALLQGIWLEDQDMTIRRQFVEFDRALQKIHRWHRSISR